LNLAVDAYEVSLRERGNAAVSIARARAHLDKLLRLKAHGFRALTWLTAKRAASLYVQFRTEPTRFDRAPSADSHRNALAAGRSFGRFAKEQGWLPADPFAEVKPIGKRKRGKPQLGLDEARRLIETCMAERSRESIAVATGFLLGMNSAEVIGRQVRDLDHGGRVLRIRKGKNEHRVRALEVPDDLAAALRELARGRPSAAMLFGRTDLDRPTRHWLYHHCQRLCGVAKVPPVSPHGLRGTHSTIAMGAVATSHSVRAALTAAAGSLGHAPGSTITATTYIAPGAVEQAQARAVGNLLAASDYQRRSGES
jgi:integrase